MANNLPATYTDMADFMRATGQSTSTGGASFPSLRVCYDSEDDDGNRLPRGTWCVTLPDGRTVYAADPETQKGRPVLFRPYLTSFQYSHFDNDEMKFVSKSVHFYDFRDEVPDTAGGFKCGKLPKKQQESLSAGEKKIQKQIKLSKVFFGTVSFEGITHSGDVVNVDNQPCILYAKGTHFMPMSDIIEAINKQRKLMQCSVLKLDLRREKPEAVVFWVVEPSVDHEVELTAQDFELVSEFQEALKAENEQVLAEFEREQRRKNNAKRSEAVYDDFIDVSADDLGDDLDDSRFGDILAAG